MGKEERKARRQARKAQRQARKQELKRLIEAIENANITFKPDDDLDQIGFIQVFNQIWPVLDPALKFAIALKVTGKKLDTTLEDVHKVGQLVSQGGEDSVSDFKEKFAAAWDKIAFALGAIQMFTKDNVDDVIDDIIEIGDWIAGE